MNSKWIIAGVFLFVIMTVLAGVVEGATLSGSGSAGTTLNALFQPSLDMDYVNTLKTVFTFDYPFFTGGWEILRWVIFLPFGIGVFATILVGLASFVTSLIGRIL